jgi:hypothetical protein
MSVSESGWKRLYDGKDVLQVGLSWLVESGLKGAETLEGT